VGTALRCPREFSYKYIERIAESFVSPEQRLGKSLHTALELVLGGTPLEQALEVARKGLLSELEHERFERMAPRALPAFLARINGFRARRQPRTQLIEAQLALDAQLAPVGFLAEAAFFRGVIDIGFEWGQGELAVVDHKSGIRRSLASYGEQLDGYAVLAVHNMPSLRRVWRGVHFIGDGEVEWSPPVAADEVRQRMTPRLLAIIEDAARNVAGGAGPTPGRHCNWCSYRNICSAAELSPEEQVEVAVEAVVVVDA
jgi:hypothetical protein